MSTQEEAVVSSSLQPADKAVANAASGKMAKGAPPSRNIALDFTKGMLVVFMVIYHWLSYFHGPHGVVYRYLRFLPPSFIFITGFLISSAYLAKYDISDARLPKRLFIRGLKILAIFVLLNVAISFLLNNFLDWNADRVFAVFVSGNVRIVGVGKAAAFYILVPISYLLLLSSVLLPICRFYRNTFQAATGLCLVGTLASSLWGVSSANLELLTIGLLGLVIGYIPLEKIDAFVKHFYIIIAAYLCYAVVIAFREPNYPLQIAGVFLTLAMIYLLGASIAKPGWTYRQILLLGKYTLYGYIVQVAILQFLRIVFGPFALDPAFLALSFSLALLLTVLAIVGLDRLRGSLRFVDVVYKSIFA